MAGVLEVVEGLQDVSVVVVEDRWEVAGEEEDYHQINSVIDAVGYRLVRQDQVQIRLSSLSSGICSNVQEC